MLPVPLGFLGFLIAVNKSERWVKKLNRNKGDALFSRESYKLFSKYAKQAKNVRDSREHDEKQYGPNPAESDAVNDVDSSVPVKITVSQSLTVRSGGRILLGGILDIYECIPSIRNLREELQAHEHQYWSTRLHMREEVIKSYCSLSRLSD